MAAILAATLTVDIPSNDVPRVSEAYGYLYQLGHNASMPEVADATRRWITSQTKTYEQGKYSRNYVEVPLEMQPTPVPTATPQPSPTAFKVNK